MAYRRRYTRSRSAGRAAKNVARKSFRAAMRMPKRKLARVYATKCGQVAWRATKKLGPRKARRYGRKRRFRRW